MRLYNYGCNASYIETASLSIAVMLVIMSAVPIAVMLVTLCMSLLLCGNASNRLSLPTTVR